jgi:hypothetical protein
MIPDLKRYEQEAVFSDGATVKGFVDWFTDDLDAIATTRAVMEQQGYGVKSITVSNKTITVEIK